MRFLSVVASTLIVVVSFNLLNTAADGPIVIPDEGLFASPVVVPAPPIVDWSEAKCIECPDVLCPENSSYAAGAVTSCDTVRRPIVKATVKVLRVPGKALKATGKVLKVPTRAAKKAGKVVRAPVRAIRQVMSVRRVVGFIFGRRR